MSYKEKYLKYKTKYSLLKEQKGGDNVQLFGQNSFPKSSSTFEDYMKYYNKALEILHPQLFQKKITRELFNKIDLYNFCYISTRYYLDIYIELEKEIESYHSEIRKWFPDLDMNPIFTENPIKCDSLLVKKKMNEYQLKYYTVLSEGFTNLSGILRDIITTLKNSTPVFEYNYYTNTYESHKKIDDFFTPFQDALESQITYKKGQLDDEKTRTIKFSIDQLITDELEKLKKTIINYKELNDRYKGRWERFTIGGIDYYLQLLIKISLAQCVKEDVKITLNKGIKELLNEYKLISNIQPITQKNVDDTKKNLKEAINTAKTLVNEYKYDWRPFGNEIALLPDENYFDSMEDFYSYYNTELVFDDNVFIKDQELVRKKSETPQFKDLAKKIELNVNILTPEIKNNNLNAYKKYIKELLDTLMMPAPPILRIKPGDSRLELSWEKPTWPFPSLASYKGIDASKILDYNLTVYSGSKLVSEQTIDVLRVILVSNLTNGTTYTCSLTARNSAGSSQPFKVEGVPKASLSIPSTSSSVKVDTE